MVFPILAWVGMGSLWPGPCLTKLSASYSLNISSNYSSIISSSPFPPPQTSGWGYTSKLEKCLLLIPSWRIWKLFNHYNHRRVLSLTWPRCQPLAFVIMLNPLEPSCEVKCHCPLHFTDKENVLTGCLRSFSGQAQDPLATCLVFYLTEVYRTFPDSSGYRGMFTCNY